MMSSLVSLKAIDRKRRGSSEPVNLEETETPFLRRSPKRAGSRRSPRARSTEQLYVPPIDSDLEHLLRSHAVQSSMIANSAAVSMGRWLAFLDDPTCGNPRAALEAVRDYERVRRSAVEDLRRTAVTIKDLRQPPMTLAARVMNDRAEIAVGPTPARLGPPTDDDFAEAYNGAPSRRALQESMRS